MKAVSYEALLLEQIKLYYLRSFRTNPEELNGLFMQILSSIERTEAVSRTEQQMLNQHLLVILQGQQRSDYVLIRDILWYEIKPFFERRIPKS